MLKNSTHNTHSTLSIELRCNTLSKPMKHFINQISCFKCKLDEVAEKSPQKQFKCKHMEVRVKLRTYWVSRK
jgi:hypothetical protein